MGNAAPMASAGTPMRTSMTRNEVAKYPVCSAVAMSDITTMVMRK